MKKGIYYSRHCGYENRAEQNKDDWHQPVEGETLSVFRQEFQKNFPEIQIQGEIEWRCDEERRTESCGKEGGCTGCGTVVRVSQNTGGITASYCNNDYPSHQIGEFKWDWSGHGANEHWFDNEAICLKSTNQYQSGSGLTASSSRIVAYKRHVEVVSFRGDCHQSPNIPPYAEKIHAEFANRPANYRGNWTGFAVGLTADGVPVIGDDLDKIIEGILSGAAEIGESTVCRHNKNVQAHILAEDPKKVSYHLCQSCRMRGVRWEEFVGRNQADICPYFRRACKSVVDRSDQLPSWFVWQGGGFLSAHRRMADGGHEAYEVVFLRKRDQFIRRVVVLFHDDTREAWMFSYNGFIPPKLAAFMDKYKDGRQIAFGNEGDSDDNDE